MKTLTGTRAISLAFALVLSAAACRSPMPCPDCDDSGNDVLAADMQADSVPDLPCGGADLLTDPRNCGTCGNDCLDYPDTEWEAGACQMGVCSGLHWSTCSDEQYGASCEEICAVYDRSCVAKGCSGHTALVFGDQADFDWCLVTDGFPDVIMDGSCDEPIPWEQEGGFPTFVMCCCE